MKQITKKHAVMMEYVIIAVLIAAAVVAVIMFGKNVSKEMNVATQAMSDAGKAAEAQGKMPGEAAKDIKKASEHEKAMHNYDK